MRSTRAGRCSRRGRHDRRWWSWTSADSTAGRARSARPRRPTPRLPRVGRAGWEGQASMKTREIGNDTVGRERVGAIGLGLMTFDQTGEQPREQLAATVRAAVDAGVRLLDTADAYGPGDDLGAKAQGR